MHLQRERERERESLKCSISVLYRNFNTNVCNKCVSVNLCVYIYTRLCIYYIYIICNIYYIMFVFIMHIYLNAVLKRCPFIPKIQYTVMLKFGVHVCVTCVCGQYT